MRRQVGGLGVSLRRNLGAGGFCTVRGAALDDEIGHQGVSPDDKGILDIGTVVEIHLRPDPSVTDTQLHDHDGPPVFGSGAFDGFPLQDRQSDLPPPRIAAAG